MIININKYKLASFKLDDQLVSILSLSLVSVIEKNIIFKNIN